jgi:DNA/RNA-binding domain of Phe-tRNA-synthetase-like protein
MDATIADIIEDFPAYRVAVIVTAGMTIPDARPAMLDGLVAAAEAAIRDRYGDTPLSEIPGIRDWRTAYRAFGIKKTSYRCSVERLVKNALAGRPLPRINAFVDAYNAVSLKHVVPAGADDLDRVVGDIAFRYARSDDSFVRLGDETGAEDPPKDGEVVYADSEKVLCRRWNWSQDARSPVTPATTRAVVTVQSLGAVPLEPAAEELAGLLAESCGADITVAILDASGPTNSVVAS